MTEPGSILMRSVTASIGLGLLLGACRADSQSIHEAALTMDTHVDIPFNFATDEVDPLDGDLQVNLEKMRAGGLDSAFFIVYVGQQPRTPENYRNATADAVAKFDAIPAFRNSK